MKKLLALPFKLVILSLCITALLVFVLGSLLINGREKTSRKLTDLADKLQSLATEFSQL